MNGKGTEEGAEAAGPSGSAAVGGDEGAPVAGSSAAGAGGEEGARHGPSLMPGGSAAAWPEIKEIFRTYPHFPYLCEKTDERIESQVWFGADSDVYRFCVRSGSHREDRRSGSWT